MERVEIDTTQLSDADVQALTDAAATTEEGSPLRLLLNAVIEARRQGASLTLLPGSNTYSPQEAADILGMSRPHLRGFMRSGALPYRMVGSHHRIDHGDLMGFAARREQTASDMAAALAAGARPHPIPLSEEARRELDAL